MKRNFPQLRADEPVGLAITKLYRHIRKIDRDYKPVSKYAARIQHKQASNHPRLLLVK